MVRGCFFFHRQTYKNRFMKQAAGIDISKDGFHVCLKEQSDDGHVKIKRIRSFPNDFENFKGLLDWSLKGLPKGVSLKYVMEVAGYYHDDFFCMITGRKHSWYWQTGSSTTSGV
ncbi:hypothetical protein Barb4_00700 [Bacteroidales bacterium Barb4]|nr:hypothetical protein Barb4_00700 [Bacteroidales bacterium Barb4]